MRTVKTPIRTTTWALAALLLVIVQGVVLFSHPGADPLRPGETLDSLAAAHWHTSEARAWLYDHPNDGPEAYRFPLLSAIQYSVYAVTGLSSSTAAIPSGLAALVLTMLVLLLTQRRFGPRTALFVSWILALEPFWNEQARRPHPYPLIALWVLIGLAWSSGCGWRRFSLGAVWLIVGAAALHPLCGFLLPVLVYDGFRRLPESARASSPRIAAAFALSGFGVAFGWFTVRTGSALSFDLSSALTLAVVAPIVTLWGAIGGALTGIEPAARTDDARFDRMAVSFSVLVVIALSATGSPAASYVVVVPCLAHLSALMVERIVSWAELGRTRVSRRRVAIGGAVIGGVALAICLPLTSSGDAELQPLRIGAAIAVAGVVFTLILPYLPRSFRLGWPAGVAAFLAAGVWIPTWLVLLGSPGYSHHHASRQLRGLLLPTASITGWTAAAMGVDNELRILDDDAHREESATHWVWEAPPGLLPPELEFVEIFHPLGAPLRVYRVHDENGPKSSYEEAIARLGAGDQRTAERLLLGVLKGYRDNSAAWTRLGLLLYEQGNTGGAYQCFLHAIQEEPSRVGAHVALASLYIRDGYRREARVHLEMALDHEPGNDYLRSEIQKLRRKE